LIELASRVVGSLKTWNANLYHASGFNFNGDTDKEQIVSHAARIVPPARG
jgi:hypothetical protein